MFFQVLDSKTSCKSVYFNNKVNEKIPQDALVTWEYNTDLPNNVQYAKFYCGGASLDDM